MQAIRIRPAKSVHPEFFGSQNRPDKGRVPKFLNHAVGEIVESADAPGMCLGADPLFAPHDDECRKAVAKLLASPQRVHDLARLKTMFANRSQLSVQAREYVEAIFGKHRAEIENETPAQAAVAAE